ncbi:MAG: hypothetical protein ACE5FT_05390 [Candidatus Nanoarchaeia archaeon]
MVDLVQVLGDYKHVASPGFPLHYSEPHEGELRLMDIEESVFVGVQTEAGRYLLAVSNGKVITWYKPENMDVNFGFMCPVRSVLSENGSGLTEAVLASESKVYLPSFDNYKKRSIFALLGIGGREWYEYSEGRFGLEPVVVQNINLQLISPKI